MKMGLYVHIPFCKSKCRYCDFNSYAKMEDSIRPYFSALLAEAKHYSKQITQEIDTVYFGGGTPSFVDFRLLCDFTKQIFKLFSIATDAEITMECNPGTIGFEGLSALRKSGINRLSIGLQSTDDQMLAFLGRIHNFDDFKNCFENARRAGFDNISLDLMYGLPNMTLDDWKETLDKAVMFNAEHISCYALKIEEGTPFSKMDIELPDDDLVADMYELAVKRLCNCGYERYEISNFCKIGFPSRHNLKYWHCDDFLGLGAGAYSSVGNRRFSNLCKIGDYIDRISEGASVVDWETTETAEDKMSEFMFLGLRCSDGVSDNEFKNRFGQSFTKRFKEPIKKYTDWGFLNFDGACLKFTDKAFFVSNTILSDFV